MRFELSVALKYLLPRFRQLSVAIISLVSTLVVAMVVWLVLVFLSVTDGLEKKWVEELVSINAPIRVAPTEAYYNSYYYQIDGLSYDSNYETKSLGEKLSVETSDPYDPTFDAELPANFPQAVHNEKGELLDLTKEAHAALSSLEESAPGLRIKEYEVSFGTLQLALTRQAYVSQVSYIANHSLQESRLAEMIVEPTAADYQRMLKTSLDQGRESTFLQEYFSQVEVTELRPSAKGFILPRDLYPKEGSVSAVAELREGKVAKIWITDSLKENSIKGTLTFSEGGPLFEGEKSEALIVLPEEVRLSSKVDASSFYANMPMENIRFSIEANVQGVPILGSLYLDNLQFATTTPLATESEPLWVCHKGSCTIPSSGEDQGVIIAKQFTQNGVRMGDRGTISYAAPGLNAVQEQKIPVYVAGFYDPGLFPMGSKLIFVEPSVTETLRSNVAVSDNMLGNGFNVWINDNEQVKEVKAKIERELAKRGLSRYWQVESFYDYEFAKPILTQLKSDKNLFTLISLIILIVACSNIISMLILLVNDKKREIAIMQAMGASKRRIALIFGSCGLMIGLIASFVGILLSLFTLRNLQSLVDFLSFLQGHDAFQAAFYGSKLPNTLSISALFFVLIATTLISIIAALVPAIKASKIRPSAMLRSEG